MTAAKSLSAKSAARLAGALAICGGCLVLIGWAFDMVALKSVLPPWISMKPDTALAFMLSGASLWLQRRARYPYRTSFVPEFPASGVSVLFAYEHAP